MYVGCIYPTRRYPQISTTHRYPLDKVMQLMDGKVRSENKKGHYEKKGFKT